MPYFSLHFLAASCRIAHPVIVAAVCLALQSGTTAQDSPAAPERPVPESRLQDQAALPLPAASPDSTAASPADRNPELRLLAQASGEGSGPKGPRPGGPPGGGKGPFGGGAAGKGPMSGGSGPRRPGFGSGRPGFGGPRIGGAAPSGGPAVDPVLGAMAPAAEGAEPFIIEGDEVLLQMPNNPVSDILNIYELLTDKTLVKDTNIFEGATISLVTPKPVDKAEAVRLIEAALLTNGYAIVADPGGQSARILPTRGQGVSQMQFSAGVNFYTKPDDLPDGETLVTYFMKLDFVDPTEAQEILANHVGLNVYGRITPVLTPPGLLITESATIVKQLISIRQAIDVGDTGSSLITKFIPVKHADAATVAQIIQATISAQASERETKGIKTSRGEAQPGPRREGDSGSSSSSQRSSSSDRGNEQPRPNPIFYNGQWIYPPSGGGTSAAPSSQVVADTRLNQILVVATPEDFTYISSLISEFDKPLDIEEPYERRLKYAAAIDVLAALVDTLKEATTGATQLPGGGTLQGGASSQTLLTTSRSQLTGGRSTTGTRGGTVTSSVSGGGGGVSADGTATGGTASTGIGGRADVIQGPTEDNAPISVLVNKTRIVADPMSNSIIVMGRKEDIEKINQLLDKLDRRPAQVYLATVIGQLTLGDGFQFGIDYLSKLNQSGDAGFTSSLFTQRDDVITNNNISDLRDNLITSAFGPAKGFNMYGTLGDSVEVFVTALESTNKFKVLSRPSVFALHNKKAVITSGQKVPYPETTITNAGSNNTNGSVTSTTAYLDVVLKLEVVPLINEDGEVNLTIAQVNDTIIGSQRIEPNDVPIIGTEQLITSVAVPNGNTVVLGGLISDEKKKDTEGLPILSRIPGIGNLFKSHDNSTTRKELIIFIQPVVVTDENALKLASHREDIRTKVGADVFERFPQMPVPRSELKPMDSARKKNFFQRLFSKPVKTDKADSTPSLAPSPVGGRR